MYQYTGCGLDNVFLENGYEVRQTPYGKTVQINDLERLHDALGIALVNKPSRLAGNELRFLRAEMELSQKRLAELLGRPDAQCVARWEKAATKGVPGEVDRLVRLIYADFRKDNSLIRQLLSDLKAVDRKAATKAYQLRSRHHRWRATAATA